VELRGFKRTEAGVIPEAWACSTVRGSASRARNAMVGGPFGSDLVSKDYVDDGVPVIRGQNMGAKTISGTFVFVNQEKARLLEANMARAGDVLFTQRGTLGQVSLVPNGPFDRYLVSQSQMKVSLNRDAVDPEFFYYLFSGPAQQEAIRLNTIQTGVPHINLGILAAIPIPIPELTEQRAIAGALSDADALIESLEQLLAKKRHLKQGAMQELLTGRRRLPGFAGEWEERSLGEIGESLIGLTYAPGDVRSSGVLVLRSSNVFEGGLRFDDNVYVDMEIPERIMVRAADILICVRNGSRDLIGKCAKVDDRCKGMTFGAFMAVFRTASHGFVYHQFQADQLKRQIREHLGATINQITNKSLNSFRIAIPPTSEEQEAIAKVLDDMGAEIDALEAKLTKARQIKQGMMQELLTGRIRLV